MWSRVFAYLFLIFTVFTYSGCALSDISQIKKAVHRYDTSLVQALAQGDADVLKECASEKQIGRVFVFIDELLKNNRLVQAELIKLSITDASKVTAGEVAKLYKQRKERLEKRGLYVISEEVSNLPHAVVKTEETWRYSYINSKTSKLVGDPQTVSYEIYYFLVLKDGKWLVDNLDAIETPIQN